MKPTMIYKDCHGYDLAVYRTQYAAVVETLGASQFNVRLEDTGNGYIARFPSFSSTLQEYYICLTYDQARDLVLALSAFQEELGFKGADK
jgi:hypothetical protein